MSNNPDPLEALTNIGDRLRQKAEEMGLTLQTFAVMPDFTGHGNHAVQAIFTLTEMPEPEPQNLLVDETETPPEVWDELDGILSATQEAEEEEKRTLQRQMDEEKQSEAVARMLAMKERLSKGKELLGDD